MKNYPKRAFILAAGYGSRMEPLTSETPKPLMPFLNKPMLQHTIEMLASWGVEDILINCHHRAECIMSWLVNYDAPDLKINISYEPEILGTGGALSHAAWWIDERPFWMINADVIAELDPAPIVKAWRKKKKPIAALWMHAERGPRTVEVLKDQVSNFHVDTPGSENTYTFCGLQLLDERILNYLPPTGFSSIIRGYLNAMEEGQHCAAVCAEHAYWADVGTPDQYLTAHQERTPNNPFSIRAKDTAVARGTSIENSVLWAGSATRNGAILKQTILGPGATAYGETNGVAVRAETVLQAAEVRLLSQLDWPLDPTTAIILPARGSDRSYIRLHGPAKRAAILIRYGTERNENEVYVSHTTFLAKHGVRVPKILADDPPNRITLMEDLGNRHLLDLVKEGADKNIHAAYKLSLEQVAAFHASGKHAKKLKLQPAFGSALYSWERNLFANAFLRDYCGLPPRKINAALKELEQLPNLLKRSPSVLIHRDLQSTNIMLVKKRPILIDYQGMRYGAAAYDLASFLADPYVMLPEEMQSSLLDSYAELTGDTSIYETFWAACLQRLSQALGAYGRLGSVPATRRFLDFIPPALLMSQRSIKNLKGFGHMSDLTVEILNDVCPDP